jgi:hypothetical protein
MSCGFFSKMCGSGDHSSDEEENFEEEPPYSAQELGAIFLNFYKFLATLHYDPSDLKIPPSQGWSVEKLPQNVIKNKSDVMGEVMRHLPYFSKPKSNKTPQLDWKCTLLSYIDPDEHENAEYREDFTLGEMNADFMSDQGPVDQANLLVIAWGYESGGINLILDVVHGQITQDIIGVDVESPEDVQEYFDKKKTAFRAMKLIGCPGRETWLSDHVGPSDAPIRQDRSEPITEEEVRAQSKKWGTDLDREYVKQVWKQHGWPDAFRREEAVKSIESFMAFDRDRRYEWPEANSEC